MPVYASSEQAQRVFSELFSILVSDDTFRTKVRESGLSLHLVQTKPDVELSVTADGVTDGAPAVPAAIWMKMSCDTAHSLWNGRLLMPVAIATGRLRIKGSVSKALQIVPILRPAFDQYPRLAAAAGVAAA